MAINIETLLKDVKEKGYNVVKVKDRSFHLRKGEDEICVSFVKDRILFYVIARYQDYEYLSVPNTIDLKFIYNCIEGTFLKTIEFKQTLF